MRPKIAALGCGVLGFFFIVVIIIGTVQDIGQKLGLICPDVVSVSDTAYTDYSLTHTFGYDSKDWGDRESYLLAEFVYNTVGSLAPG
jgi:hypothetical protein